MMKKTTGCFALGMALFLPAIAGTMGPIVENPYQIYAGGYGGYGQVMGAYGNDGNFAQGRFALGVQGLTFHSLFLGLEGAVQSGNSMPLSVNTDTIAVAGGLQPQVILKPFVDLLATVEGPLLSLYPVNYVLKGGIAYRQMQFTDRTSFGGNLSQGGDVLNRVNGEFQAGLGYTFTDHARITAFYQGIYANSNAKVRLNTAGDLVLQQLPTQQAGFLGFEYRFF